MARVRTLGLFDLIAMLFAAWFSLEIVASQATIGWSMVACLIFFGIVYFVVHAMICAELGSTYPEQGGIYVWIKRAMGPRWAARTTWWYWVNVAGYVPSLLVVAIAVYQRLFWPEMSMVWLVVICIAATWLLVWFNCIKLSTSKWLPTIASIAKALACIALVAGAIGYAIEHGPATPFTGWRDLLPHLGDEGVALGIVGLVGVYVYSLTGCDIMATAAGEMRNPERDLPRSIFSAGFITIALYIITAVAILLVIPMAQVDKSSGFIDALIAVYGHNQALISVLGVCSVIAFFGSMLTWSYGGNRAAQEAGEAGELPKIFAKSNAAGSPVGAAVLLGIVTSALVILYGLVAASNETLFWTLLAFTAIIYFLPYLVLQFAFLKLREKDPDIRRPFRVPGRPGFVKVLLYSQVVCLAIAILSFFILPPEDTPTVQYEVALAGGIAIVVIIGEIVLSRTVPRSKPAQPVDSADRERVG